MYHNIFLYFADAMHKAGDRLFLCENGHGYHRLTNNLIIFSACFLFAVVSVNTSDKRLRIRVEKLSQVNLQDLAVQLPVQLFDPVYSVEQDL